MKYGKQKGIIIKRIGIVLFAMVVCMTAVKYRQQKLQEGIADKILRFHVIANSDSETDQKLKLQVRDKVGAYLNTELKEADSRQESEAIIQSHMKEIETYAKEVISEEGYNYSIQAFIKPVKFPKKTYGSYLFPAGTYQALEVVIGNGDGHNWWCVMYPNMCFYNSVYEVVDDEADRQLRRVLTSEEYEEIMAEGDLEVRFKLLDDMKKMMQGTNADSLEKL